MVPPPGHLPPPIPPPHSSHGPPGHPLPPPPSGAHGSSTGGPAPVESAWERGLRHAKEMIVKASKRKEEEIDFDDKRFNLTVNEEGSRSHHSKDSSSPKQSPGRDRERHPRSPSPYHHRDRHYRDHHGRAGDHRGGEYWDPEYERRRRLAYESAPWNDNPHSPPPLVSRTIPNRGRETAEQYRDPWRRSKSPTSRRRSSATRRPDSVGKRSHSVSSISGSDSDPDLSDSSFSSCSSFGGSSLSGDSDLEATGGSPHPPKGHKGQTSAQHRPAAPPPPPPQQQQQQQQQPAPARRPVRPPSASHSPKELPARKPDMPDVPAEGATKRKLPPAARQRRDSWSDSDSLSGSQSGSSTYSGSGSESDSFYSDSEEERQKHLRKSSSGKPLTEAAKQPELPSTKSVRTISGSGTPDSPPPSKKAKMTSSATRQKVDLKRQNLKQTRSPYSQSSRSPTHSRSPHTTNSAVSPEPDVPKKNPIKMTFMKKV